MTTKQLTTTQSKIIGQLESSPLAWIGIRSRITGYVIFNPAGTSAPFGSTMSESTFQSLRNRGRLDLQPIPDAALQEHRRRMEGDGRMPQSKTHGWFLVS